MKRALLLILFISVGFNIYFLIRKLERIQIDKEHHKLHFFKDISYEEGYTYFLDELTKKYPEVEITEKKYVVYMWDSISYDILNKSEMTALDSMAAIGNYKLEYVFATEMEEKASENFLKRNKAEYKNVRMLYNMDDYISGLYHNADVKLVKQKEYFSKNTSEEDKEKIRKGFSNWKKKPFYVIMDSNGKILFNKEKNTLVLKDSLFLKKLKLVSPYKSQEILN